MKSIAILAAQNEEIAPLGCAVSDIKTNLDLEGVRVFTGHLNELPYKIVGGVIGVGKTLAAMNTQKIIDLYGPSNIFLIGSCGGAISGVALGDLIVPSNTAHSDYDITCSGYELGAMKAHSGLLEVFFSTDPTFVKQATEISANLLLIEGRRPSVHTGLMTSRDSLLTELNMLNEIEKRFRHIGWDMEAAAVNTVAHLNGIPCNIVKGVLDKNGIYDKELAKRIGDDVYENAFRFLMGVLGQS